MIAFRKALALGSRFVRGTLTTLTSRNPVSERAAFLASSELN
jgi:hypothetical protein